MAYFQTIERLITIIGIALYSDAGFTLVKKGQAWVGIVEKILHSLMPLILIMLLCIRWRSTISTLFKEKWVWIFMIFPLLSIFWSEAPEATSKASFILAKFFLFGIYFGTRYSLKEQVRELAIACGIIAIASLFFGLFLPTYGLMGNGLESDPENIAHAGTWRGVFTHKNAMGRFMTFSSVVFLLFTGKNRKEKYLRFLGLSTSILLIVLSTSKSSLVILTALLTIAPLLKSLRWRYSRLTPFLVAVILFGSSTLIFLVDNAETILGAIGRDMTLTGRTDIWEEAFISISEKPYLGYGLGGFWMGLSGASEIIVRKLAWSVPHSHNGFVDLTLDLGLIGLFVFLFTYLRLFFSSIDLSRKVHESESLFPIIFLFYLVMINLTESSLFRQGFFVFIFIGIIISVKKLLDSVGKKQSDSLKEALVRLNF